MQIKEFRYLSCNKLLAIGCATVEDKWQNWQAFEGAERIAVQTSVSYAGRYEDNLVYKF